MRITVSLPDELVRELDKRPVLDSPSSQPSRPEILAHDLWALYSLEEHTRAELAKRFFSHELGFILDLVAGWAISWPGPSPKSMLSGAAVDAAVRDGLDGKWFTPDKPTDFPHFLEMLGQLTSFQAYVLIREAKLARSSPEPLKTLAQRLRAYDAPPEPPPF